MKDLMSKVFLYNLVLDLSERGMVLDRLTLTTNGSVLSSDTRWLHNLELSELSQVVSVSTLMETLSDFSSLATVLSVFTVSFR